MGVWRNRGKVSKVVILTAVGDGFQIFRISPVGDTHTGDLALLCHIYRLLLFYNRIVGKLVTGDPTAFLHQSYNAFCVRICLRDLIQCLFYKLLFVHKNHSFYVSFYPQCDNIQMDAIAFKRRDACESDTPQILEKANAARGFLKSAHIAVLSTYNAVGIVATSVVSAILVGLLVASLTLTFAGSACLILCLADCEG